jgi:hypothetical protein
MPAPTHCFELTWERPFEDSNTRHLGEASLDGDHLYNALHLEDALPPRAV